MAIVTLRLNDEEEKILELLVKYFDADKSKILKEAMWDKYEDLRDLEIIGEFERKERAGKIKFESADALIQSIVQKKKSKKQP
jgi:predicted DNA-binding protein